MKSSYKNVLPSTQLLLGVGLGVVLLFILGSCFDYNISQSLYHEENSFGRFFAAFGEYPALLGLTAAGTMLFSSCSRQQGLRLMAQRALGLWLILSGSAIACLSPMMYLSLSFPFALLIAISCSLLVVLLIRQVCQKANHQLVFQAAIILIIVIFSELILINLIKIPWGRARMRLVVHNPYAYFMPWWQIGDSLKIKLMATGVAAEEFKSFPSGHTANASVLMLLCLLPLLKPELTKYRTQLFLGGVLFAVLVGGSRIIMGAHYLTDTVVGFTLTLLVILAVCHKVLKE